MFEDPELKAMHEELAIYYRLEEKDRVKNDLAAMRKKYGSQNKAVPEPMRHAIAILSKNNVKVTSGKATP